MTMSVPTPTPHPPPAHRGSTGSVWAQPATKNARTRSRRIVLSQCRRMSRGPPLHIRPGLEYLHEVAPHHLDITMQINEAGAEATSFVQERMQEVLRPDVVVAMSPGDPRRRVEHVLHPRGELDSVYEERLIGWHWNPQSAFANITSALQPGRDRRRQTSARCRDRSATDSGAHLGFRERTCLDRLRPGE